MTNRHTDTHHNIYINIIAIIIITINITIITINTIIFEAVTEKLRRIETACLGGRARLQRGCGATVQDNERESVRTSSRGGVLAPGGGG